VVVISRCRDPDASFFSQEGWGAQRKHCPMTITNTVDVFHTACPVGM